MKIIIGLIILSLLLVGCGPDTKRQCLDEAGKSICEEKNEEFVYTLITCFLCNVPEVVKCIDDNRTAHQYKFKPSEYEQCGYNIDY